jgi:hypothetical protein
MKALYLIFFLTVGLFFYGCGSDSASAESGTGDEPLVLGTYTPSYKSIDSFDDAALAISAVSLYSKAEHNREISDVIKEEIVADILKPAQNTYEKVICDNGGILESTIDTESNYKDIVKKYTNCELNTTLKNGTVDASLPPSSGDVDNDIKISFIDFENGTLKLKGYNSITYNMLENEDDYDFKIENGSVDNSDYAESYNDFNIRYIDKKLTLDGVITIQTDTCMAGNYLIKTLEPITSYGYGNSKIKGKIIINDTIFEFDENEAVKVTLKNAESKTIYNARAFASTGCSLPDSHKGR